MSLNVYNSSDCEAIIARINQLQSDSQPLWGKMSVAQMLAHCNVTYSYTFTPENHEKPNFLVKFLLKTFVKPMVVNDKPYPKSSKTAKDFIIKEDKNFEQEKQKLLEHILNTQSLGEAFFEGKENFSFGTMTAKEWNNLFYKHLDHHLKQFGV
jgi:hypothetical protein